MKVCVFTLTFMVLAALSTARASEQMKSLPPQGSDYLPTGSASKIASVTTDGIPAMEVVILTEAVAVKETGPKQTVSKFGEVYAFSPTFIAVYRDEPTRIRFWNLQPDDDHDFMMIDPHRNVLMKVALPALKESAYLFTFHEEGVFNFYCTVHRPAMNGQILVLPPRK